MYVCTGVYLVAKIQSGKELVRDGAQESKIMTLTNKLRVISLAVSLATLAVLGTKLARVDGDLSSAKAEGDRQMAAAIAAELARKSG